MQSEVRPNLAFPDNSHGPSLVFEGSFVFNIPFRVASALLRPEVRACRRDNTAVAAAVTMPEAAVDENRQPVFGQNYVGFAGKVLAMHAKSIAHRMQKRADFYFRFSVHATNRRHIPASLAYRSISSVAAL